MQYVNYCKINVHVLRGLYKLLYLSEMAHPGCSGQVIKYTYCCC